MSFIVTEKWLGNRMKDNLENIVIIDVRFKLTDPTFGEKAYKESHIPHSVYLDLEKDLSGTVGKHGGNHPLPPVDLLVEKLGKIGVDEHTTVLVYDQGNDMYASRLWWMIHYLGHQDVYLLDGGFKRWVEAGNDTTDQIHLPAPKVFTPTLRQDLVVDINEVKEKLAKSAATLIDSRAEARYLGYEEPLYKKAGHIPGAKNFFWQDVLNENGKWKDVEQLKGHFSILNKKDEIIVSCGSGVSACPNIIGLLLAGYTNVKLYPGGYSDWLSYDDNQIRTEEE